MSNFPFQTYAHSTWGLKWTTNWPPGSLGESEERLFMEAVARHRETGFGRMIQLIEETWGPEASTVYGRKLLNDEIEALKAEVKRLRQLKRKKAK